MKLSIRDLIFIAPSRECKKSIFFSDTLSSFLLKIENRWIGFRFFWMHVLANRSYRIDFAEIFRGMINVLPIIYLWIIFLISHSCPYYIFATILGLSLCFITLKHTNYHNLHLQYLIRCFSCTIAVFLIFFQLLVGPE